MMNRFALEEEVLKENPGCTVEHKLGIPLTVVLTVDGKQGPREILPPYYMTPVFMTRSCCMPAVSKTAKGAKDLL